MNRRDAKGDAGQRVENQGGQQGGERRKKKGREKKSSIGGGGQMGSKTKKSGGLDQKSPKKPRRGKRAIQNVTGKYD